MRKTFTLTEARELLPVLRREMELLQPIYARLKDGWQAIVSKHGLTPEDPAVRDLCMENEETRELLLEVEEGLSFFNELGVECAGIEEGIFDFPCLIEDRVIYLCWQVKEGEISYWHEVDSSFDVRRHLFEATKSQCQLEERLMH